MHIQFQEGHYWIDIRDHMLTVPQRTFIDYRDGEISGHSLQEAGGFVQEAEEGPLV